MLFYEAVFIETAVSMWYVYTFDMDMDTKRYIDTDKHMYEYRHLY